MQFHIQFYQVQVVCRYTMINEHYKIMAEDEEINLTANLQTSV